MHSVVMECIRGRQSLSTATYRLLHVVRGRVVGFGCHRPRLESPVRLPYRFGVRFWLLVVLRSAVLNSGHPAHVCEYRPVTVRCWDSCRDDTIVTSRHAPSPVSQPFDCFPHRSCVFGADSAAVRFRQEVDRPDQVVLRGFITLRLGRCVSLHGVLLVGVSSSRWRAEPRRGRTTARGSQPR